MNKLLVILGAIVVVLGIIASSAIFIVDQREQVIVFQFGDAKRVIQKPGINMKVPFIQNTVTYDKRVLAYDPPPQQLILSDQKRLDVDVFLRYRIKDPLRFYQAVQTEAQARDRLAGFVVSSLRRVLGNVTLLTVLSDERTKIMSDIGSEVNLAATSLGLEVVDVRIRRADLPEQAAQAIFARMRSEREREAREARAQGFEAAQQIRAGADRERTVLIAEARKQSEITRGEGDRQAIKIYADSFGQDPEFFRFYRSMQAYRESLKGDDTTMVLSPDSEFFRFFGTLGPDGPGAGNRVTGGGAPGSR